MGHLILFGFGSCLVANCARTRPLQRQKVPLLTRHRLTGEQHLKPNCHFGPAIRLDGLLPFEDGSVLWHTSQGKAQRNGCFVEWLACLEYG
jgi:hypothetical protein